MVRFPFLVFKAGQSEFSRQQIPQQGYKLTNSVFSNPHFQTQSKWETFNLLTRLILFSMSVFTWLDLTGGRTILNLVLLCSGSKLFCYVQKYWLRLVLDWCYSLVWIRLWNRIQTRLDFDSTYNIIYIEHIYNMITSPQNLVTYNRAQLQYYTLIGRNLTEMQVRERLHKLCFWSDGFYACGKKYLRRSIFNSTNFVSHTVRLIVNGFIV